MWMCQLRLIALFMVGCYSLAVGWLQYSPSLNNVRLPPWRASSMIMFEDLRPADALCGNARILFGLRFQVFNIVLADKFIRLIHS